MRLKNLSSEREKNCRQRKRKEEVGEEEEEEEEEGGGERRKDQRDGHDSLSLDIIFLVATPKMVNLF